MLFFPPKYGILRQPTKKWVGLSFKRRFSITLYSLLRSSLPEDMLKDQWHVPLHKDLLLKSGDFIQFSWRTTACSPYSDKTLTETPMPLKSQLQTFSSMNNIQHTLLINVSSITAIYLSFSLFFSQLLLQQNALHFIVNCDKKKEMSQINYSPLSICMVEAQLLLF